jgi:hypothetical protein
VAENHCAYDKPATHADRHLVDINLHPLLDENGREVDVFTEDGFKINWRVPKQYDICGTLLDLRLAHTLYKAVPQPTWNCA